MGTGTDVPAPHISSRWSWKKNCPDVAVLHRQCLSWRSCKHFLLPWSVHLSGYILAIGKEPAQVLGLA